MPVAATGGYEEIAINSNTRCLLPGGCSLRQAIRHGATGAK